MKKRMTSFLMVLVMVVGMCIPASATETSAESLELIPVEDVDASAAVTVISDDTSTEEMMPLEIDSTPQDTISADIAPYSIGHSVSPKEAHIYPIVLNTQTSEAFIINSISRSAYWNNASQAEAYPLYPEQVQALMRETAEALATNSSTSAYEWAFIGWYIKATVLLYAERPRRVEVKQTFSQSGTNYETETLTVSSQSTELHLAQGFYYTPNVNFEKCHFVGFDGNFYFTYTSGSHQGQEGGTMFSIGFFINAPKAA